MAQAMEERQVLARIDKVSLAIKEAEPGQLGKAIRLLDAMKRMAVGKKWVGTIGQADAWCLKARRRAGEIVEATSYDPKEIGAYRGGPGGKQGPAPKPRTDVREQLGISEHESHSWQALAKIPEPVFEEFVEKVAAREEDGTISNALSFAKAEKGEPETHVSKPKRSHDEIRMEEWTDAVRVVTETVCFDNASEFEDMKYTRMGLEMMEGLIEYYQRQVKKTYPLLKGGLDDGTPHLAT